MGKKNLSTVHELIYHSDDRKLSHILEINLMTLPNTNYFSVDAVHKTGSIIERELSRIENREMYGIQHLIEHLSFKSTKNYSTDILEQELNNTGRHNACTSMDVIRYYMETNTENYKKAIELIIDVATNDLSRVTPEEFEKEKQIIYNEIKTDYEDNISLFFKNNINALYNLDANDNTHSIPEVIETFTLEDVRSVKQSTLRNNDLMFNIIYDPHKVSLEDIRKVIKDAAHHMSYTDIRNVKYNIDIPFNSYRAINSKTINIDIETNENVLAFYIPTLSDSIGYDLIADYLKEYSNTNLNKVLREEHALTYSVNCQSYKIISRDNFLIVTLSTDNDDIEKVISLIKSSILSSIEEFEADAKAHRMFIKKYEIEKSIDGLDLNNYNKYLNISFTNEACFEYYRTSGEDLDVSILEIEKIATSRDVLLAKMIKIKECLDNSNYTIIKSKKKGSAVRGESSVFTHKDNFGYITKKDVK